MTINTLDARSRHWKTTPLARSKAQNFEEEGSKWASFCRQKIKQVQPDKVVKQMSVLFWCVHQWSRGLPARKNWAPDDELRLFRGRSRLPTPVAHVLFLRQTPKQNYFSLRYNLKLQCTLTGKTVYYCTKTHLHWSIEWWQRFSWCEISPKCWK